MYGSDVFYYDEDDPVVNYLKEGVFFGAPNFKLLESYILNKENKTIVDCGAHIGTFSFPASRSGHYNVIAIEGAVRNVECLNRSFANIDNVRVVHAILSDSIKKCRFSHDYGPFGCLVEDSNGELFSNTIDNIVGDEPVAGIKLDIEGGEIEALMGAREIIKRDRPVILIEVNGHCLRLRGLKPKHLFDIIKGMGYEIFANIGSKKYRVNSDQKFPYCVADVLAFHNEELPEELSLVGEIEDELVETLIKMNKGRSNEDCLAYFNSL